MFFFTEEETFQAGVFGIVGKLGSQQYVQNLISSNNSNKLKATINLDMIGCAFGRTNDFRVRGLKNNNDREVLTSILTTLRIFNKELGLNCYPDNGYISRANDLHHADWGLGYKESDQYSFGIKNLPSIQVRDNLPAKKPRWHGSSDSWEINIQPDANYLLRMVKMLTAAVILADAEIGTESQFPDVDKLNTFYFYITALKNEGIISGYSNGEFKPKNKVHREEITKFVANSIAKSKGQMCDDFPIPVEDVFVDIPSTHPFAKYIKFLKDNSIISELPDGTFTPAGEIKRGELSMIIANGILYSVNGEVTQLPVPQQSPFSDVPINSNFARFINYLKDKDIISGYSDGSFRPDEYVSREQLSKFIFKFLAFISNS